METKRFLMIKAKEKMYWQNLRYLDFERYRLPNFVDEASETMEYCNYDLKCRVRDLDELYNNIIYLLKDGGVVALGEKDDFLDGMYTGYMTFGLEKYGTPCDEYFKFAPSNSKPDFDDLKEFFRKKIGKKTAAQENDIFRLAKMTPEKDMTGQRTIPDSYVQYFSKAEDVTDFEIAGHNIAPTGKFYYSRTAVEEYIARKSGKIVGSISGTTDMIVIGLEERYSEGSRKLEKAVAQKKKRGDGIYILSDMEFHRWQYMNFRPEKRDGILAPEKEAVREKILFGHWPQAHADRKNLKDLEWIVLGENENDILLLSKDIITCRPFDEDPKESLPSWKGSSIKAWLNEDFLQSAFNREEQRMIRGIRTSDCAGGSAQNTAYHYIFLLSDKEVKQYLDHDMGDFDVDYGDAAGWILRSGSKSGIKYCTAEGLSKKFADQQEPYAIRPAVWWIKPYVEKK